MGDAGGLQSAGGTARYRLCTGIAAERRRITEMLKIMALCDLHKVGIMPHFTGPIATVGHMHTMMAFPGQVLMEYNQHDRPVPYMPQFLDFRNGKVARDEAPPAP